ncbi:ATP-binding response regulator [Ruminococcus albus]|uniref:Circadian input-output histidine kinase CikA n=1 Tax=Ruminococcus albus TaxID=1264 RepID=A0A1I1Q700_RUMAL|nr:sensor histidine kinase [Ruminococcus albus]SFD15003.1 Signal transduction histidine kinase [Ruminococcus albus]
MHTVIIILIAAAAAGLLVWLIMMAFVIRRQTEELSKAKAEVMAANAAKTRFLANISHELLTPVNTIVGMNEMAMRENAENVPTQYFMSIMNYCFDIRDASESLVALINDLLAMSDIESGKAHLEEQEYDTKDMLRSLINKVQGRCSEKDLYFKADIDELLPSEMYGDTDKITQILTNLLSNAAKYTDVGGVVFTVSMLERENNICKISYSVRDTGKGLTPEEKEKIFAVYERLDETAINQKTATGLGLDISRKFAEMMGGELVCKSEYGKGAEFILTIPQKMIDQTPVGDITGPRGIAGRGPYIPQFIAPDADILVIDNDPMSLKIIKGLLKDTDVFVSSASSIEDCIDRIKDTLFSVVFIDQMLIPENAAEIIKKMRTKNPDLPIYLLTSNSASREMYYTAIGFTGYLPKPVDGVTLERTILKHIPPRIKQDPPETQDNAEPREMPWDLGWLNDTEGISAADGIRNSGGIQTYITALRMFAATIDNNIKTIRGLYENNDMMHLNVKIHSMSRSARIIGALELSRFGDEMERAAHSEDREFIDANINEFLRMYGAYKDKLSRLN